MADVNTPGATSSHSRPVDLAGDSPELIAFALLRYLAQLEQEDRSITFDRAWMLDAYAECLEAVQGKRKRATASGAKSTTKSASVGSRPRKAA